MISESDGLTFVIWGRFTYHIFMLKASELVSKVPYHAFATLSNVCMCSPLYYFCFVAETS